MGKQFCPGYSSSIFSQATPYFTFQFPPLCKRRVLTYFRLFLRWKRRRKDERERKQRQGTAGFISSLLLPVSPKVWEYGFKKEWKRRLKTVLSWRSLLSDLQIPIPYLFPTHQKFLNRWCSKTYFPKRVSAKRDPGRGLVVSHTYNFRPGDWSLRLHFMTKLNS